MAYFPKPAIRRSRLARAVMATLLVAPIVDSVQAQQGAATLKPVTVQERSTPPQPDIAGLGDAPLARTPVSATMIEAAQIEAVGARRLADLFKFDASVSDAYNAIGYWDYATVRGFVIDNRYNYRREGLPISAETFIPLDNKSRVEILKGTSGIQAGTSAPGGLVNYAVKRPTENDLRSVRLETTGRGGLLGSIDLGGRFGNTREFGYRLNAASEDIHSYAPGADGQRKLLALAMDWRIGRDSLLEAEIEYSHRAQPSVPGLSLTGNTVPAPNPRLNLGVQPWTLPVALDSLSGSVRFEQALNSNWRWSAQAGTQRLKSDDRSAFPFGCTDPNGVDYYADRYCPGGGYDLYDYRSENERRTVNAAQLQLKGRVQTGGVRHELGFGLLSSSTRDRMQRQAYNYVGTGNLAGATVFAPDPRLTDENTNRDERSTEISAFDAIAWTERFSTWVGVRNTRLSRDSVRTDGSRATSYDRGITTPWIAASYQLTPATMVYASHGQGVESEVAPGRARYINAGQPLPALKSRQTEIGIKGSGGPDGRALRWSAAWFDISRPLFGDLGACDVNGSCTRQADGEARHRGLELGAGQKLGQWSLDGGLTLIDAKRQGGTINPALNGKRPTNVPDWILRASAEYRLAALPGMSLQGHLSHEGRRAVLPDQSAMLPAWTRVDAALRYQRPLNGMRTTWTLGVDNLFDKRYFKEAAYQFSHAYLFTGAPRTVRLSFQAEL